MKNFLKATHAEKIDIPDTKTIETAYNFPSNIIALDKVTISRFVKYIPFDDVKVFLEENNRTTAKDDAKILKLMKKRSEAKQCLQAKHFLTIV